MHETAFDKFITTASTIVVIILAAFALSIIVIIFTNGHILFGLIALALLFVATRALFSTLHNLG